MYTLYKSFGFAINGIKFAILNERNFRVQIFGFLFMLGSAFYFDFEPIEWMISLIIATQILALELINTSLEKVVDIVSPDFHSLAKVAKDCAAASVLLLSILSVVIWGIIVYQKVTI